MIGGAEAGWLVLRSSGHAADAATASWPPDRAPSAKLSATVGGALERRTLFVQTPESEPAPGLTHVALPIVRHGRAEGAFGVSVRGLPPTEVKALAGLLGHGVRSLALLLDVQSRQAHLEARLAVAGSVLDHEELAEASHALAIDVAQSLGCDQVGLGLRRGNAMRVVALSTGLRITQESDPIRRMAAAMQEAVDEDELVCVPPLDDDAAATTRAHDDWLRHHAARSAATIPLVARGEPIGALACAWSEPTGATTARDAVREIALVCGPLLELMRRAEAGLGERLRTALGRFRARHFGPEQSLARASGIAAAVLLVALAVVPAPYRIAAQATLEGRVQRALVAGVDGYIAEANVRAGDVVTAGEVLARLDDRDLRLAQRKTRSEKTQLEKQYREALAGRDRTQVSLLRARIDRASAEHALATEQLGRTEIVAPFDGIVLEGDLDQSLGSPVELGSVLFEIAPLDGYRIIVEVDGRDIADVEVGQTGRLALEALPGSTLPLRVERITPISTSEDGRSYFRVDAVLEEPSDRLRPGMEGIAKIDAGSRRLLWILTHGLLDWLRLATWSVLP